MREIGELGLQRYLKIRGFFTVKYITYLIYFSDQHLEN
jgi:hypothetical protein